MRAETGNTLTDWKVRETGSTNDAYCAKNYLNAFKIQQLLLIFVIIQLLKPAIPAEMVMA